MDHLVVELTAKIEQRIDAGESYEALEEDIEAWPEDVRHELTLYAWAWQETRPRPWPLPCAWRRRRKAALV